MTVLAVMAFPAAWYLLRRSHASELEHVVALTASVAPGGRGRLRGFGWSPLALLRGASVVLAVGCGLLWPLASTAGAFVYWAGYNAYPGAVGRANLDGSGVAPAFAATGGGNPCGVAVDAGHVYWAGSSSGEIGRANLDGSGAVANFVSGAGGPCGVAVDATHIYWANGNHGYGTGTSIGRANLDGTGVNQAFIAGASGPCGVAVDAAHVYWANTTAGTIGRANLDGTGADESFVTGANGACGVAVDSAHVYWTDQGYPYTGNGTIGRANLDGTSPNQNFITGAAAVPYDGTLCGVAVDSGHIYWDTQDFTGGVSDRIERADLNGTGVVQNFVTIPEGGSSNALPCGVAVDALLPTATTVSQAPSSTVYGQALTLAATVVNTPSGAPLTPTGTVQFAINGHDVGSPVPVDQRGRVTLTPPDPVNVDDAVTASYSGNAHLGASISPTFQPHVQPAASALALSSSVNPQTAAGDVTFTAAATNLSTSATPFGSVQFIIDGQPALSPVAVDGTGHAGVVVSAFEAGNHVVTAKYHDDTGTLADFTDSQASLTEHITSVSKASASPGTLAFGSVSVGPMTASSPAMSLTVTNTGASTLHLGQAALAGANAPDYKASQDACSGQSLAAATPAAAGTPATTAGSCAIRVTFAPTGPGGRAATVQIPSDDPATPLMVAISGNGTAPPTLAGAPVVSGSLQVGQTLTCNSPAITSPGAPPTTTFAWLRDTAATLGASAATYATVVADAGHKLACRVTATNSAGQATAPSTPVTIPASPPPKLTLRAATATIDTSTGRGVLIATCAAPTGERCTFIGAIYTLGKLPAGVARITSATRLGTVTGAIAAARTGRLTLRLTPTARTALRIHGQLKIQLAGRTSDAIRQSSRLHKTLTIKGLASRG